MQCEYLNWEDEKKTRSNSKNWAVNQTNWAVAPPPPGQPCLPWRFLEESAWHGMTRPEAKDAQQTVWVLFCPVAKTRSYYASGETKKRQNDVSLQCQHMWPAMQRWSKRFNFSIHEWLGGALACDNPHACSSLYDKQLEFKFELNGDHWKRTRFLLVIVFLRFSLLPPPGGLRSSSSWKQKDGSCITIHYVLSI